MALSQFIGVCGCGCPSSSKVIIMILGSFSFRDSAPSYESAADAAKILRIVQRVNIVSLSWTGCLSCGFHQRKTCFAYQLCAYFSDK